MRNRVFFIFTLCSVVLMSAIQASEDTIALVPIRENRPALDRLEADLLAGARMAEEQPLKVLDVGCGTGEFLPKIFSYLDDRDFKVELWGVDTFELFHKDSILEIWNHVRSKWKGIEYEIFRGDVEDMSPEFDKSFDLIFVNAPFPDRIPKILLASLKLMKADGILVWRFHAGEDTKRNAKKLFDYAGVNEYEISLVTSNLPQGKYPLEINSMKATVGYVFRKQGVPVREGFFERVFGARLAVLDETDKMV